MYRLIFAIFLLSLTQIAASAEPQQDEPPKPAEPAGPKIALSCGTLRGEGKIIIVDENTGTVIEIMIHCTARETAI